MTEKEKLEKLKKLADAMYYAAQYLTTDASSLRKTMENYRQFIINEYHKEEPASEEFEEAGKEWLTPQLDKSYANYGETKMMELTHFDGYAMLDAIEFGANWQKQQMMAKAIEATCFGIQGAALFTFRLPAGSYLVGSEVKVIIVKSE